MWAPADLFSPVLNRMVSYFYEHLMVLTLVVLAVVALITAVTVLGGRRAGRN